MQRTASDVSDLHKRRKALGLEHNLMSEPETALRFEENNMMVKQADHELKNAAVVSLHSRGDGGSRGGSDAEGGPSSRPPRPPRASDPSRCWVCGEVGHKQYDPVCSGKRKGAPA